MSGPAIRGVIQSQPQSGDLVVVRTAGADGPFSVQRLPGEAQFRASTRTEAVQIARGFAQRHAVDIWCADQGAYRLLERYRPPSVTTGDKQRG